MTVLESTGSVGGRVGTETRDGYLIERGAQLITSTYSNALGLVKELGLEAELRPTSPWMAIVKDGRPRRLPSGAMFPIYALTSGLVSIPDLARFIWHTTKLKWPPVDNYAAWAEYDDMDTARWAAPRLGRATDYLVEPLIAGGLLCVMEETSRAATLATLALTDNGRGKEMSLSGGLGRFPEALAAKVEVKLESPVQSIEVRDDGAFVQLSGEQMRADHVVLAATAPIASQLYRGGDEVERRLLATEYARGIKIGIATSRHWRNEPGLKDVWAFLVPRPDRQLIASATLESAKDITRVPDGEMLNLFVKNEATAATDGSAGRRDRRQGAARHRAIFSRRDGDETLRANRAMAERAAHVARGTQPRRGGIQEIAAVVAASPARRRLHGPAALRVGNRDGTMGGQSNNQRARLATYCRRSPCRTPST